MICAEQGGLPPHAQVNYLTQLSESGKAPPSKIKSREPNKFFWGNDPARKPQAPVGPFDFTSGSTRNAIESSKENTVEDYIDAKISGTGRRESIWVVNKAFEIKGIGAPQEIKPEELAPKASPQASLQVSSSLVG